MGVCHVRYTAENRLHIVIRRNASVISPPKKGDIHDESKKNDRDY